MKMNYRRINSPSKIFTSRRAAALLIIVFLAVFFLGNHWLTNRLVDFLGSPLWRLKEKTAAGWFQLKALVQSRRILLDRQRQLAEKLQLAELRLVNLPVLEQENNDLKNLLRLAPPGEFFSAAVILRPPQTAFDVLMVAAGEQQGLKGGEKVFLDNLLLGEIIEVYRRTAKVRLLSSAGLETQAFVQRLNLPVRVLGLGGGNFEARLPIGSQVEVGDVLVVLDSPVRLLGQVSAVEKNPTEAWERLLFRFPVNFSELRWLTIAEN